MYDPRVIRLANNKEKFPGKRCTESFHYNLLGIFLNLYVEAMKLSRNIQDDNSIKTNDEFQSDSTTIFHRESLVIFFFFFLEKTNHSLIIYYLTNAWIPKSLRKSRGKKQKRWSNERDSVAKQD